MLLKFIYEINSFNTWDFFIPILFLWEVFLNYNYALKQEDISWEITGWANQHGVINEFINIINNTSC